MPEIPALQEMCLATGEVEELHLGELKRMVGIDAAAKGVAEQFEDHAVFRVQG